MFDNGVEAPSTWLTEQLDALGDLPLQRFDASSALAEVASAEWVIAGAQARQLRALARFAQLRPDRTGVGLDEFAADEVAALLGLSRTAAQARLELAVELSTRLPGTLAALDRGDLDLYKARTVAELTRVLSDEHAAAVENAVLDRAATQTAGQLRAALRRAIICVDPAGAQARYAARLTQRRVLVEPGEDGTCDLIAACIDAADAVAAYQRLDLYARTAAEGDTRTTDQRRADALIDLLLGRAGELPPAQVHLTVAASTILGADDEPGELAGYGPITADAARALAADGTWRRILTDPATGAVLDVGRRRYRPPTALSDHVRFRDRTCRFPGCRQPARRCDLDHVTPYPVGATDADNLASLCRHHHRLKHEAGWRVGPGDAGAITWTSPTGRTYRTEPDPP